MVPRWWQDQRRVQVGVQDRRERRGRQQEEDQGAEGGAAEKGLEERGVLLNHEPGVTCARNISQYFCDGSSRVGACKEYGNLVT